MALEESRFGLEAAGLKASLRSAEAADPAMALSSLRTLEAGGAAAVLVDLPAAWLPALAREARQPLLNIGAAEDALREQDCHARLFHVLPSERMRADALAQWLVVRNWKRVLLLHGPLPAHAARLASVQGALRRYRLTTVATRPFELSADPRERERANVTLLTAAAQGDHDAVWVVDVDGEFARGLPFRTALPRPVVGDGGLAALAWAPNFERFGAPQLARRFARAAGRPMTGHDWAAWMAAKAVLQAALAPVDAAAAKAPLQQRLPRALAREDLALDGFKGVRLGFRPWDRQLRQPLLLSDGVGVVGLAPADGLLHPRNVLDTLGADAPERLCKPTP